MRKVHVLYNPKAGKGKGESETKKLGNIIKDCELIFKDITKMESYSEFKNTLETDDAILISGGDGTLSRFATAISDLCIKNPIYYYATGSGNDFLKDTGKNGAEPFLINEYIEKLPVATINGEDYLFINGIGGGLDAYACEIGNRVIKNGKQTNYVLNAVKGILYDYNPMNVHILVDGKEYEFKNVWFASVMRGRYFGGGIMLAPNQNRKTEALSAVVVHSVGRLRMLPIIPGAFKGNHVKYTQYVEIIEGNNIEVYFDRPQPLQVDGECVSGVTKYSVKTKIDVLQ